MRRLYGICDGRNSGAESGAQSRTVRIACTEGMAFDLLPGVLARFRQQHPAVSFDLQVGTAMQVAEWVRRNDCDVAFQFSLAPERDVEIIARLARAGTVAVGG